jgi:hypothetical protein
LVTNAAHAGPSDEHWALRVVIAILALLAVVMVTVMARDLGRYQPRPETFHDGEIKSPVLAVELARNRDDLVEVLQTTNPVLTLAWPNGCGFEIQRGPVCALRINTTQDCVFIPLYAGFLLCMALLFSRTPRRGWLGMAGAALAVTVALFDYAENRGIFKALGTDALTDQTALAISNPSRAKWILLGVTLLFIGLLICISRLANFRAWGEMAAWDQLWIGGIDVAGGSNGSDGSFRIGHALVWDAYHRQRSWFARAIFYACTEAH